MGRGGSAVAAPSTLVGSSVDVAAKYHAVVQRVEEYVEEYVEVRRGSVDGGVTRYTFGAWAQTKYMRRRRQRRHQETQPDRAHRGLGSRDSVERQLRWYLETADIAGHV